MSDTHAQAPVRDWLMLERPPSAIEQAALADDLLPDWLRRPDADFPRTSEDIISASARRAGISSVQIKSGRREARIVHARHEAAYWLARLTTHSTTVIANMLGGQDHSTILSAIHSHATRAGVPDICLAGRKRSFGQKSKILDAEEALRRKAERAAIFQARTEARYAKAAELAKKAGLKAAKEHAAHRDKVNDCTLVAARWCAKFNVAFWHFSEPHITKSTQRLRAMLVQHLARDFSRLQIIDALGIGEKSYRSAVAYSFEKRAVAPRVVPVDRGEA